jgi:hypothetical protein
MLETLKALISSKSCNILVIQSAAFTCTHARPECMLFRYTSVDHAARLGRTYTFSHRVQLIPGKLSILRHSGNSR